MSSPVRVGMGGVDGVEGVGGVNGVNDDGGHEDGAGNDSWGSALLEAVMQWWAVQELAVMPGMWKDAAFSIEAPGSQGDPLLASMEAWYALRSALPDVAATILSEDWGSVFDVDCESDSCPAPRRLLAPVWQMPPPVQGCEVVSMEGTRVICPGCGKSAAARLVVFGAVQCLLVQNSSSLYEPGLLMHSGANRGRVLVSWTVLPSGCRGLLMESTRPLPMETLRCKGFRAWTHRRFPLDLEKAQRAVHVHLCCNEACVDNQDHGVHPGCALRSTYSLPSALVGLVRPLHLDTDLMTDWVHKCSHPCITRWFSGKVDDVQLGSAGDVMQADLKEARLLIHFPSTRRWSATIAPLVVNAMLAPGATTVALVVGAAQHFRASCLYDGGVTVTRLASTSCDTRGRPDRHQSFRGASTAEQGTTRSWGVWWVSKHSPRPGNGIPWAEVVRSIKLLKGVRISDDLTKLAEGDSAFITARKAAEKGQARRKAVAQLESAVQGVTAASTSGALHDARNWLRTVITQEYLRRGSKGKERNADLVRAVADHFPAPHLYFGHERGRSTDSFPDLELRTGGGVADWATHFRGGAHDRSLCLDTRLPNLQLLKASSGSAHLVWWSPHLVQEQVLGIQMGSHDGLLGEYLVQVLAGVIWVPSKNRVYVDIQAHDGLLRVQGKSGPHVLKMVFVPWDVFLDDGTIFDWDDVRWGAGPVARTMSLHERMQHLSRLKGVQDSACVDEDAGSDGTPDKDSIDSVRRVWALVQNADLPECSEPVPKDDIILPPIKIDLSSAGHRELFRTKVTLALSAGANSTQALRRAAQDVFREQTDASGLPSARGARRAKHTQKKRKFDGEDPLDKECEELLQACDGGDAKTAARLNVTSTISKEHALRCRLGIHVADTLAELAELTEVWLTTHRAHHRLVMEADWELARRKRRDAADKVWRSNQSQAFADMTKPPARPADCSLQTIAEEVRDRGSVAFPGHAGDLGDAQAHFGPHYAPHPSEQYGGQDLLTAWDAAVLPVMPDEPSAQPLAQPRTKTAQELQEWRECRDVDVEGRQRWLREGQRPLPTRDVGSVHWPDRTTAFEQMGGRLAALVVHSTRCGTYRLLPDNTMCFTYKHADLLRDFSLDGLMVGGQVPDAVIVTDGSGSHEVNGDASPCGFGTFIITAEAITVLVGGSRRSTSGLMELAAARAGFDHVARTGMTGLVLLVSDYKTLVDADLGRHRSNNFRKLQNVGTWQCLVQALERALAGQPSTTVARVHAKSHEGVVGHWGQQMNEVADVLAKLGRAMANELAFDLPDEEGVILTDPILPWVPPDLQVDWAVQGVLDKVAGPAHVCEVTEGIHTRGAQGHDVNGICPPMAKVVDLRTPKRCVPSSTRIGMQGGFRVVVRIA